MNTPRQRASHYNKHLQQPSLGIARNQHICERENNNQRKFKVHQFFCARSYITAVSTYHCSLIYSLIKEIRRTDSLLLTFKLICISQSISLFHLLGVARMEVSCKVLKQPVYLVEQIIILASVHKLNQNFIFCTNLKRT